MINYSGNLSNQNAWWQIYRKSPTALYAWCLMLRKNQRIYNPWLQYTLFLDRDNRKTPSAQACRSSYIRTSAHGTNILVQLSAVYPKNLIVYRLLDWARNGKLHIYFLMFLIFHDINDLQEFIKKIIIVFQTNSYIHFALPFK